MIRQRKRSGGPAGFIVLTLLVIAAAVGLGVFFGKQRRQPPSQEKPAAGTTAEPSPARSPKPPAAPSTPAPKPEPARPLPPPQTVTLECVADNSIIAYPKESLFNHGAKSSIRIKGIDHVGLFKFDTAPIKGMVVEKAVLRLTLTSNDLFWAGVSSVARDWVEGKSSRYAVDREGRGSCFLFASWSPDPKQAEPWGRFPIDAFTPEMMLDPVKAIKLPLPREDFNDVSFFPGRCIFSNFVKVRAVDEKVREIEVPPGAVELMAAGLAWGLAVQDGNGETGWNTAVASRESNSPPQLIVTGRRYDETPPQAPEVKATAPAPHKVKFTVVNPADDSGNLAYVIRDASGREIPRNRINGLPGAAGSVTEFFLYDVPAGRQEFRLAVVDRAGNIGPFTTVRVEVPDDPPFDLFADLPRPQRHSAASPASILDGHMTVWAVPITAQVDPVSGRSLHRGDERTGNEIWDPASLTASLHSARNEVAAFQLVLEPSGGAAEDVSVEVSSLSGPGEIPSSAVSISRTWYVKGPGGKFCPDPCVPLSGPFSIPWKANAVPNQKNQSLVIEIAVPKDAPAGDYSGAVSIRSGTAASQVRINLTVWPFAIPDYPTFVLELNAYSGVGKGLGVSRDSAEYEKIELLYHQLGHAHRQTVNVLPYSQAGALGSKYYVPEIEGEGASIRVKSWGRWDDRFGKYFDGSAFSARYGYSGLWRNTPVTHFYLPFHENWPAPINKHYKVKVDTIKYPDLIIEHARKAPRIEEAFDKSYADAFQTMAREYVRHFKEKGWSRTRFQLYLNNKYYWKRPRPNGRPGRGTSWWLLDEPRNPADFQALRWFGKLFWDAVGPEGKRYADYRIDLSRPQWQHDTLDGLATLVVVSSAFYPKHYVVENRKDRLGETYWHYGGGPEIGENNLNLVGLVYKDWSMGADGGLPYYTSFAGNDAWKKGNRLGLVLPGTPVGIKGPVATLRLKVLRRAQQDIEYLNLAARKFGRDRVAGSLAKAVNLTAQVKIRHADDPGRATFSGLEESTFEAIRIAVARLLK